jgi:hypothetical protein
LQLSPGGLLCTVTHSLNPPAPDLDDPAGDVQLTKTGTIVDYGNSLRFRFDHDDQALCWEELVIVD